MAPLVAPGKVSALAVLCAAVSLSAACGDSHRAGAHTAAAREERDRQVLNLYTWADYLAPDTIPSFEKLTGIKVHASYFDSNETLESRMLTGHSGFDVVIASGPYFERQLRSGAYRALDESELPNLRNLDPAIAARAAAYDPGNAHGVVYTWGTFGIGYNERLVGDALPHVAIDSWRLIFDPAMAAKLARCGINMLDAPAGVVRLVLKYLGRNPDAPTAQDLAQVESVLLGVRPYIRTIDSTTGTQAMVNGDICIALSYSDDMTQARRRAREAGRDVHIGFVIPKEGSLVWYDLLAIPRDAPHVASAYAFINYLMDPEVIARITDYVGSANGNAAATRYLDPATAADPVIYPPPAAQTRLFLQSADSAEQSRAITRLWQKFKTAQ